MAKSDARSNLSWENLSRSHSSSKCKVPATGDTPAIEPFRECSNDISVAGIAATLPVDKNFNGIEKENEPLIKKAKESHKVTFQNNNNVPNIHGEIASNNNGETNEELSEGDIIQVKKDINRSMHNFDFFNSLNEETAEKYKRQLEEMILELLSNNKFNYYQGYNELCSVFLLVLGSKQGTKTAEMVSKFLIKDFLFDSFEKGVRPMLFMLNELLKAASPEFYKNFASRGVSALLCRSRSWPLCCPGFCRGFPTT
eukprot:TRINITY_DN8722_c0_g2_i2.p1 TRINITY_DN8722_c0_g2~~TRINITY_DN8722_c0_g2_i2.p1  ORF type:complete len:255 (-),score=16.51 TRINITY_DN8722_c0_g2_i2:667-1431(-)